MSETKSKPPLQLKLSFYPEVCVKANPNFRNADDIDPEIETSILIIDRPRNSESYQLVLRIWTDPKGEAIWPYKVDATIVGEFKLADPMTSSEEATNIVALSGSSLLYGAVRETIHSLTARGPWGPWLLPTLSPRALVQNAESLTLPEENDDAQAANH